ncbi:hypothetical protein JXA34_01580 [Patescibacteria group bacterium]|nr:hypothetical protein [Patescibacteria group bacterium]
MRERMSIFAEKVRGIVEEVYLDTPENGATSFEDDIATLTSPGHSRRERVKAAVSVFQKIAPEFVNRAITERYQYNSSELPFSQELLWTYTWLCPRRAPPSNS